MAGFSNSDELEDAAAADELIGTGTVGCTDGNQCELPEAAAEAPDQLE